MAVFLFVCLGGGNPSVYASFMLLNRLLFQVVGGGQGRAGDMSLKILMELMYIGPHLL